MSSSILSPLQAPPESCQPWTEKQPALALCAGVGANGDGGDVSLSCFYCTTEGCGEYRRCKAAVTHLFPRSPGSCGRVGQPLQKWWRHSAATSQLRVWMRKEERQGGCPAARLTGRRRNCLGYHTPNPSPVDTWPSGKPYNHSEATGALLSTPQEGILRSRGAARTSRLCP